MNYNLINKKEIEEGRCVWCGEKKVKAEPIHHDYWDGTKYCSCGCKGEKEEKRLREEIKKAEEHLRELNLKLRKHRQTSIYYKELVKLYAKKDEVDSEIEKTNEIKYDISDNYELRMMVATEANPIDITDNGFNEKFEVILD